MNLKATEQRIRVDDPSRRLFEDMAASTEWRKLAAQSAMEVASIARKRLPPTSTFLDNEAAAQYLAALIPVVQDLILDRHNSYGSVRWLWYLRRTPNVLFEGSYGTTLGYDRALAEALSWHQPVTETNSHSSRVFFKVDNSAFRHLCRYIGCIKFLSQLHIAYRRVGKGAVLDLSSPFLFTSNCEKTEAAITLYDTRHDRSSGLVGFRLGLVSLEADVTKLNKIPDDEPEALLLFNITDPIQTPVIYPHEGNLVVAEVDAYHVLKIGEVRRILNPLTAADEHMPDYVPTVVPLLQLLVLMPALYVRFPWTMSGTVQQGYVFVREDALAAALNDLLPGVTEQLRPLAISADWHVTYETWKNAMDNLVPSLWPLRNGGILRNYGTNIMIDVTTATSTLLQRVEFNRSPLLGNERAGAFERQCQELIDSSQWRPVGELAAQRGRTLRRSGIALTDIDAIGAYEGRLLLVSCKSLIYDADYDKGDYRVIRNSQSTVDSAVKEWDTFVMDIQANPVGDNFDFSHFTSFIGIVCTPFVVYSDNESTNRMLDDGTLRACISSLELKEWLGA